MPMVHETKLRWGILGTAEIARKNWKAIQLSGNSTVTAVASRDLDRSRRFVAECQAEVPLEKIPEAFGSYEALLVCDKVDAVYIPLPTGMRKRWVIAAAEAGKHVICEKPCAASLADLQEMLEICQRRRVQFMDDVMFLHSLRFQRLRQVLDDGLSIGQIRRIDSAFSFPGSNQFFESNIRVQSELEPAGCLGDLGWYCIRFSLWAMNGQLPLTVSGWRLSEGRGPNSPAAVPTEFSGEMLFEGGVSAAFYCSFVTDLQQWAIVAGTRGYLEISDFVLPFAGQELGFDVRHSDYRIQGCDFRMHTQRQSITVSEWSHGHPTAQETNCFRNFAEQVHSRQLNESWPEAALNTQRVMAACLDSARDDGRSVRLG